jgi:hypothetical protein
LVMHHSGFTVVLGALERPQGLRALERPQSLGARFDGEMTVLWS